MRPVFVGFGFASGAFGAVSSQRDLRSPDDQGEPDYRRERDPLSQQNHPVHEREDARQVVPRRCPFLSDLDNERVVEQEGHRRAGQAEHDHHYHRPRFRHLALCGDERTGSVSTALASSEKVFISLDFVRSCVILSITQDVL